MNSVLALKSGNGTGFVESQLLKAIMHQLLPLVIYSTHINFFRVPLSFFTGKIHNLNYKSQKLTQSFREKDLTFFINLGNWMVNVSVKTQRKLLKVSKSGLQRKYRSAQIPLMKKCVLQIYFSGT